MLTIFLQGNGVTLHYKEHTLVPANMNKKIEILLSEVGHVLLPLAHFRLFEVLTYGALSEQLSSKIFIFWCFEVVSTELL